MKKFSLVLSAGFLLATAATAFSVTNSDGEENSLLKMNVQALAAGESESTGVARIISETTSGNKTVINYEGKPVTLHYYQTVTTGCKGKGELFCSVGQTVTVYD